MTPVVIYLHGFLSSPQSEKARVTQQYVEVNLPDLQFEVPQIPNYPDEALACIEQVVARYPGRELRFIGSSMGGYLSTYLVEKHGGKAVLINPAVTPFELLRDYLGEHINPYTQQVFTLEEKHMAQLLEMDTPHPQRDDAYWVLLQTGDETLDYRQAEAKYAGHRLTIEQGGDHSFVDYPRHLPEIFEFLLDTPSGG